jgi:hypothetical protein
MRTAHKRKQPEGLFDGPGAKGPVRLTPRDDAPPPVVPVDLRPLHGGPVIVCERGDASQPRALAWTEYAIDTAETRDLAWWRERIEAGKYGRPALRLVAYPDVDTMADGETIATAEAGLDGAPVRVVMPDAVAVRVYGFAEPLYATTTGEVTSEGLDVVSIARTTMHRATTAVAGPRNGGSR